MKAEQLPGYLRVLLPAEFLRRHLNPRGWNQAQKILERAVVRRILLALYYPRRTVWVNLFAPVEILHAMGLNPLFLEGMAALASGAGLERPLLQQAEALGLARTVCSYHRVLVGMGHLGLFPTPAAILTTTTLCDNNTQSFEFLADHLGVPFFLLDVPYEQSPQAIRYLAAQLRNLVSLLERITRRRLLLPTFEEVIRRVNQTRQYMLRFYQARQLKKPDGTLGGYFNHLFASHNLLGSKAALFYFKKLCREMEEYPELPLQSVRLLWLHLAPHFNDDIFDWISRKGGVIVYEEMNQIYWEEMDPASPFESVAKRLIANYGNGGVSHRIDRLRRLIRDFRVDGVIHFSHWGCRQSSGHIGLLKRAIEKEGVFFLNLDGDCVDSENYSPGQIKTRLEGFLEMVRAQKALSERH